MNNISKSLHCRNKEKAKDDDKPWPKGKQPVNPLFCGITRTRRCRQMGGF